MLTSCFLFLIVLLVHDSAEKLVAITKTFSITSSFKTPPLDKLKVEMGAKVDQIYSFAPPGFSLITVGAIFFEYQNACLKSARMHQSSKSLWPS